jgi:phosphotransferase system enzyme I (PtsI)
MAANLATIRDRVCVTQDGVDVHLGANLEVPEELPSVIENGAEAIGLYRTEFFYLSRSTLPTEEAQYQALDALVRPCAAGHDPDARRRRGQVRLVPGRPSGGIRSSGMRGLRFSLQREDIFRTQLRAILGATVGRVRVMFPMVIGVEDFGAPGRSCSRCGQTSSGKKCPWPPTCRSA